MSGKSPGNSHFYHTENEVKPVFTSTFSQGTEDFVGYQVIDSMECLDTTMSELVTTNAFSQQPTAGRAEDLATTNIFPWLIQYDGQSKIFIAKNSTITNTFSWPGHGYGEDGLSNTARAEDSTTINAFPWPGHEYGEDGLSNTARAEYSTATNAFPWPGDGYGEDGLFNAARAEDWTMMNTFP